MSLRSKVESLERLIGPSDEKQSFPFLLRDEMAVFTTLEIERLLRSKPKKCDRPGEDSQQHLPPEELQRLTDFINYQIKQANAIEAEGRLPEVLARLRAKRIDFG